MKEKESAAELAREYMACEDIKQVQQFRNRIPENMCSEVAGEIESILGSIPSYTACVLTAGFLIYFREVLNDDILYHIYSKIKKAKYGESSANLMEKVPGLAERLTACRKKERDAVIRSIVDSEWRETKLGNDGTAEYDMGTWKLKVVLQDDFTLRFINEETGKSSKTIPKKGTDTACYVRVKNATENTRSNLKHAVEAMKVHLMNSFLRDETWNGKKWQDLWLSNRLVELMASKVVWQQGNEYFIPVNGKLCSSIGKAYSLTEEPVKVAHPLDMPEEEIEKWQQFMLENKIKQPFEQVWEIVYQPKDIAPDRYEGALFPYYLFRNTYKDGIECYYDDGECLLNVMDGVVRFSEQLSCDDNSDAVCFLLHDFEITCWGRDANHIIYLLDKWSIRHQLRNDDISIMPLMKKYNAAQISEFITIATENGATNLAATLLEYKKNKFPEFDVFGEFTLDG